MVFTLFLTFAKIGLFTFGGGYAMISIIENICVEKKKWITHHHLSDRCIGGFGSWDIWNIKMSLIAETEIGGF